MEKLKFNHDSDNVVNACYLSMEEVDSINRELANHVIDNDNKDEPKSKFIEYVENLFLNGTPVQRRVLATHAAFAIQKSVLGTTGIEAVAGSVGDLVEKIIQEHVCKDCQDYEKCDLPYKNKDLKKEKADGERSCEKVH